MLAHKVEQSALITTELTEHKEVLRNIAWANFCNSSPLTLQEAKNKAKKLLGVAEEIEASLVSLKYELARDKVQDPQIFVRLNGKPVSNYILREAAINTQERALLAAMANYRYANRIVNRFDKVYAKHKKKYEAFLKDIDNIKTYILPDSSKRPVMNAWCCHNIDPYFWWSGCMNIHFAGPTRLHLIYYFERVEDAVLFKLQFG